MGKSMDFSEGIKLIREAHSDATAVIAKWRALIEAPGEVVLTLRMDDGTAQDITLPSIREAINRYLGGVFEQITLIDGNKSIIIRMNDDGQVELVHPDDSAANVIVGDLIASRISGRNGTLPIIGKVNITDGTIQKAVFQSLLTGAAHIKNATFMGTTVISGSTRITGDLSVKKVSAETLDMGNAIYRKQVVKFGIEGLRTNELNGTNGDIFTGDVSVLEAAGIYAEPTWADCTYTPNELSVGVDRLHIYWGTPDMGDLKLMGETGSYEFYSHFAAIWPYKMYEPVDGGYRIRWLPLDDNIGRIHYGRIGKATSGVIPTCIDYISGTTGAEVRIASWRALSRYSCGRFMAAVEEESDSGVAVDHNLLYRA